MEDGYDLLEEYEELAKKYDLPSYERLAEDFDVEKLEEKESSFLLREIRKVIVEKLYSYLHLVENLINPNHHPLFIMALLKNMTPNIKEQVKQLYKQLSKLQMQAIRLDLLYKEENEATFIMQSYTEWQTLKSTIDETLAALDTETREPELTHKGDYFG